MILLTMPWRYGTRAQGPCRVGGLSAARRLTEAACRHPLSDRRFGFRVSNMSRPAPLYVQFLHVLQTSTEDFGLPKLDAVEEEILNTIGRFQAAGEPLCVKELLHSAHLGSPSRIFDRLRAMRASGWVQLLDTSDNRRKRIVLTEEALCFFDHLGACIHQVAGAGAPSPGDH